MAHQLEMINGEAQMAFVGDREKIWHRLGYQVPDDLTPEQIMKAAGLDWEVEKHPLFADIDGKHVNLSKKHALVRSSDHKILDVVGVDWNPVQNSTAFEFFNDFVAAGEMKMDTAGSLKGGNLVWALAKTQETFTILGEDRTDTYLLFSNPHQFGKSIDVRMVNVRCVCNNTVSIALNEKSKNFVKVNHRANFDSDMVKETLGVTKENLRRYKEMAEFLSTKRFANENIVEYFNRVFPATTGAKKDEGNFASRAAKQASEIIETQPGAEYGRGSMWSLFNAVTYLTNHELGRSDETRLHSAWYGPNQKRNTDALNIAIEMANAL